jgi:hypothetical protein
VKFDSTCRPVFVNWQSGRKSEACRRLECRDRARRLPLQRFQDRERTERRFCQRVFSRRNATGTKLECQIIRSSRLSVGPTLGSASVRRPSAAFLVPRVPHAFKAAQLTRSR